MQFSNIQALKKTLLHKATQTTLRIVIFVLSILYIAYKLYAKKIPDFTFLAQLQADNHSVLLLAASVFFPCNWALEALKWKYLVKRIEPTTFKDAYIGVLTGLTFGFITPQSLGDFAGRTLQMKSANRFKSAGALLIGNFAQFYVALVFGIVGYVAYLHRFGSLSVLVANSVLVLGLIVLAIVLLAYFNAALFMTLLRQLPILHKVVPYLEIIDQYSRFDLSRVLFLSSLRYCVFTVQFLLMFRIFGIGLDNMVLLNGIVLIFFTKSVIPSFNMLGDLGIREFSALYFFSHFLVEPERVVAASLSLWFINILFPTLVGLLFIFKIKFLTTKAA